MSKDINNNVENVTLRELLQELKSRTQGIKAVEPIVQHPSYSNRVLTPGFEIHGAQKQVLAQLEEFYKIRSEKRSRLKI